MKQIRHLIAIVFLLCGLIARGSERGYDHEDMVGTFKYNQTSEYILDLHLHSDKTFMVASTTCEALCRHFGNWEVKGDLLILRFDKQENNQQHIKNELDQYIVKELEILDKDKLFWGHHLQDGYERRVELQRSDVDATSMKRKNTKGILRNLIEDVIKDVL